MIIGRICRIQIIAIGPTRNGIGIEIITSILDQEFQPGIFRVRCSFLYRILKSGPFRPPEIGRAVAVDIQIDL